MIGTYRFCLALVIAAFHAGWLPWHLRLGLPATMAFLMISGHGVSALGEQFFPGPPTADLRFWLDRALRIYPQYLFWMAVTAVVVLVFHRHWLFQFGQPDWVNIACNLTIFPLSFFMFIPSLAALFFLPQAWSLSTELFFYVLFPALARFQLLAWACVAGGLAVFCLASMGVLQPEWFAYRLLPGTLPFLLLGRAVWRRDGLMQGVILAVFHLDLAVVWLTGNLGLGVNREVLFGVAPTYALLVVAARMPEARWDRRLGDITYGLYLSQMSILATINGAVTDTTPRVLLVAGGAALLGAASFFAIERPVNRLRRRMRPHRPPRQEPSPTRLAATPRPRTA